MRPNAVKRILYSLCSRPAGGPPRSVSLALRLVVVFLFSPSDSYSLASIILFALGGALAGISFVFRNLLYSIFLGFL